MAFDNYNATENMESGVTEKKHSNLLSYLLIGFIILLLLSLGYTIWNNNEIKETIQQKESELAEISVQKDTLQSLLDEATMKYDFLKTINVKRDSTILHQEKEITKIKLLIQSLITTVKINLAEHNELKQLIDKLNANIETYKNQIETTNAKNLQLIEQKSMAAAEEEKIIAQKKADETKETIAEKPPVNNMGSSLYATNFKNSGFEESKKGKLKKTHSARAIDLLRISFDLEENNAIASGSKDLYISVIAPDGTPLVVDELGSGKFTAKDGKEKPYTHKITIDYTQGQHQKVSFDWRQNKKFAYGKYKLEVYNNGFKIGEGLCNFKRSGVFD